MRAPWSSWERLVTGALFFAAAFWASLWGYYTGDGILKAIGWFGAVVCGVLFVAFAGIGIVQAVGSAADYVRAHAAKKQEAKREARRRALVPKQPPAPLVAAPVAQPAPAPALPQPAAAIPPKPRPKPSKEKRLTDLLEALEPFVKDCGIYMKNQTLRRQEFEAFHAEVRTLLEPELTEEWLGVWDRRMPGADGWRSYQATHWFYEAWETLYGWQRGDRLLTKYQLKD